MMKTRITMISLFLHITSIVNVFAIDPFYGVDFSIEYNGNLDGKGIVQCTGGISYNTDRMKLLGNLNFENGMFSPSIKAFPNKSSTISNADYAINKFLANNTNSGLNVLALIYNKEKEQDIAPELEKAYLEKISNNFEHCENTLKRATAQLDHL